MKHLLIIALALAAPPAFAQQDMADRIDALERRVEALERALGRVTETPTTPGGALWTVEVVEAPADRRAEPGPRRALLAKGDDILALGAASDAAATPVAELMVVRRGMFTAASAGYFDLGVEITYPPSGVGGYLGGFLCTVALYIDDRRAMERRLRRPYGRQDRVETLTATERLRPARYRVEQRIACAPDGRHDGDSEPALRQIEFRSLVKRPNEREARPADPADFQAAAG